MNTKMGYLARFTWPALVAIGLVFGGVATVESAPPARSPAKAKPKTSPKPVAPPMGRDKAKPTERKKPKLTAEQRLQKREKQHQTYMKIMQGELERNLKQLKTFPAPKVFSTRYRMRIRRGLVIRASDGHIFSAKDTRNAPLRMLGVSIRVGDHKFDQTGKDGYDWRVYQTLLPSSQYCPKGLTPLILKSMLWKQTDWKYRVATGQYWRKRYVRSTKPKIFDKAGDFSKEPATVYMAPLQPEVTLDKKKWKGILKRVTNISNKAIHVVRSGASLRVWEEVILGVGQDGSKVRLRKWGYNWSLSMSYLGKKSKELVKGSDSGYGRSAKQLPTEAELKKKFRVLWQKLKARTESPEGEPDSGPAIVDPQLAGAIFYDILMVRLEANRFLNRQNPRIFANQMNKVIIPTFLTIVDNPLLQKFGNVPLSSHYMFDDEWVPARRLVMVKDGVLKNFYLSRKPYKQYNRSNGHGRNEFGRPPFSRPGSTIVKSKKEYSLADLKKRLIVEAKRQGKSHGYILTKFSGYSNVRNSIYTATPESVLRVDVETGKTTLVKGLQVRTAALQVIRGIIATGNDYTVFNGSDSENSGTVQITTVSPSLLIKRLVFHRRSLPEKKTYELPPPFTPITLKDIKAKTNTAPTCPKQCPEICKRCPACKK